MFITAFLLLCLFATDKVTGVSIKLPAIFRTDTADFHKYAAVLAALAPHKKTVCEEIKREIGPIQTMLCAFKGIFGFLVFACINCSNKPSTLSNI
jgi:hypothetical protein